MISARTVLVAQKIDSRVTRISTFRSRRARFRETDTYRENSAFPPTGDRFRARGSASRKRTPFESLVREKKNKKKETPSPRSSDRRHRETRHENCILGKRFPCAREKLRTTIGDTLTLRFPSIPLFRFLDDVQFRCVSSFDAQWSRNARGILFRNCTFDLHNFLKFRVIIFHRLSID